MPAPDPSHIALLGFVVLTFVLAGFVKGVVGLGLPTVAIACLSQIMPPAHAAALLIVPSIVTNVWQLTGGPRLGPLVRRLGPLLAGTVLGTAAGIALIGRVAPAWAPSLLGAALLAYAGLGLSAIHLPAPGRHERWLGPLTGVATGAITAATGVFVMPAVPYLQALALERDALVQALGLSFTVSTLALAVGLGWQGHLAGQAAWGSVLAVVPAVVGMQLGQRCRRSIAPALFRRCLFGALALLGAQMVVSGLR